MLNIVNIVLTINLTSFQQLLKQIKLVYFLIPSLEN